MEMTDEGIRFRKVKANVGIYDDRSELEGPKIVDQLEEEAQEGCSDSLPCHWEEQNDKECLYVPRFWDYIKGEITRLVLIFQGKGKSRIFRI